VTPSTPGFVQNPDSRPVKLVDPELNSLESVGRVLKPLFLSTWFRVCEEAALMRLTYRNNKKGRLAAAFIALLNLYS
jgi:hypothetical protein